MLHIVRVPVLSDNYSWLVHDDASGETMVVDPGEAAPVEAAAVERGWTIGAVWLTHWHPDHIGGADALRTKGARVIGPEAERAKIPMLGEGLGEGDVARLGDHAAQVMTVPGHTQGHIAFHFADDAAIFTGDTLFAMGCGRLFEGTPADMFGNMRRYAALPDDTRVYCGHEYTLSNAHYAAVAEPDNADIAARLAEVSALRERGEPTVPTTIAAERATNPFLRASSVEELAERRAAKDAFRG
jgi:hydroxyacylglutathione hydrolase